MERGWRPNVEISSSCPRCGSTNTKFCYYNNYSLTQPRYFCKGCRRYWTKGGSLRNVPVGGGCRKNRRGKSSVRPPTHVVLQSKTSGYESMPNGQPFRHECLHRGNISSSVESSSTARTPDGLHIDLALVYAKFLNPQPDSGNGFDLPEFPGDFDPSLEFTNNSMPNTALHQSVQLAEENGAFDNCLSDNEHLKYNSELYASHGTSNHGLPLLPGEEAPNQDILWPRSIHTMGNHSTLQLTQQPMLGPETQYDPKLLFDNWSPFGLSTDHLFSGA